MNIIMFKSFVKEAAAIQTEDENTPADYILMKTAISKVYPSLQTKLANPYAELAGLGTLAAPSIQELRHKPMSEKNKAIAEVGGLGILAAPYAGQIAKKVLKR